MSEYVRQELLDAWIVAHDKYKARAEAAEQSDREAHEALLHTAEQLKAAERKVARVEEIADVLAVTVLLLAHDAHPTYANTTGWRGGIGGSALTRGCSIIDPPPGADWTQADLPTMPARDWIRNREIDLNQIKTDLKATWNAVLNGADDA